MWYVVIILSLYSFCNSPTGPRSAVGNVSDDRLSLTADPGVVSFDPGPVTYFPGD